MRKIFNIMIAGDDSYYYTVEGIAKQEVVTTGLDKVLEDIDIYDLEYVKHDGTRTKFTSKGLYDAPPVFCQQVLNDLEKRIKGMFAPIDKSQIEKDRVAQFVKRMGERLMNADEYQEDE